MENKIIKLRPGMVLEDGKVILPVAEMANGQKIVQFPTPDNCEHKETLLFGRPIRHNGKNHSSAFADKIELGDFSHYDPRHIIEIDELHNQENSDIPPLRTFNLIKEQREIGYWKGWQEGREKGLKRGRKEATISTIFFVCVLQTAVFILCDIFF